ncbi:Uncharacterised protein [Mycobacteroides abscessus subsp. abscessus]|nr:Uncharacterised protein [Mycobacteroides abscessus subsp. abscessus]
MVRPRARLPTPPITAPMPIGITLPAISAMRLVRNRTTKRFISESFIPDRPGIRLAISVPQFCADRPTERSTICMPLSPSTTASTSARRCSLASGAMPCTAATASV